MFCPEAVRTKYTKKYGKKRVEEYERKMMAARNNKNRSINNNSRSQQPPPLEEEGGGRRIILGDGGMIHQMRSSGVEQPTSISAGHYSKHSFLSRKKDFRIRQQLQLQQAKTDEDEEEISFNNNNNEDCSIISNNCSNSVVWTPEKTAFDLCPFDKMMNAGEVDDYLVDVVVDDYNNSNNKKSEHTIDRILAYASSSSSSCSTSTSEVYEASDVLEEEEEVSEAFQDAICDENALLVRIAETNRTLTTDEEAYYYDSSSCCSDDDGSTNNDLKEKSGEKNDLWSMSNKEALKQLEKNLQKELLLKKLEEQEQHQQNKVESSNNTSSSFSKGLFGNTFAGLFQHNKNFNSNNRNTKSSITNDHHHHLRIRQQKNQECHPGAATRAAAAAPAEKAETTAAAAAAESNVTSLQKEKVQVGDSKRKPGILGILGDLTIKNETENPMISSIGIIEIDDDDDNSSASSASSLGLHPIPQPWLGGGVDEPKESSKIPKSSSSSFPPELEEVSDFTESTTKDDDDEEILFFGLKKNYGTPHHSEPIAEQSDNSIDIKDKEVDNRSIPMVNKLHQKTYKNETGLSVQETISNKQSLTNSLSVQEKNQHSKGDDDVDDEIMTLEKEDDDDEDDVSKTNIEDVYSMSAKMSRYYGDSAVMNKTNGIRIAGKVPSSPYSFLSTGSYNSRGSNHNSSNLTVNQLLLTSTATEWEKTSPETEQKYSYPCSKITKATNDESDPMLTDGITAHEKGIQQRGCLHTQNGGKVAESKIPNPTGRLVTSVPYSGNISVASSSSGRSVRFSGIEFVSPSRFQVEKNTLIHGHDKDDDIETIVPVVAVIEVAIDSAYNRRLSLTELGKEYSIYLGQLDCINEESFKEESLPDSLKGSYAGFYTINIEGDDIGTEDLDNSNSNTTNYGTKLQATNTRVLKNSRDFYLRVRAFIVHMGTPQIEELQIIGGNGVNEWTAACENWTLPHASFHELWESLVVDNHVKQTLLEYSDSLMLPTSTCNNVTSNVNRWNRLLLLHGPSGTGKTSLCKGLAQKLSIRHNSKKQATPTEYHLLEIQSHSLFSDEVSNHGKLIQRLFQCIQDLLLEENMFVFLLIDGIESLAPSRDSGTQPVDVIRAVNSFLSCIDKLRQYNNVMILATTNCLKIVDEALIDRADLKLYINLPDMHARYEIMRTCINDLMMRNLVTLNSNNNHKITTETTMLLLDFPTAVRVDHANQNDNKTDKRFFTTMAMLSEKLLQIAAESDGYSGRTLLRLPLQTLSLLEKKKHSQHIENQQQQRKTTIQSSSDATTGLGASITLFDFLVALKIAVGLEKH